MGIFSQKASARREISITFFSDSKTPNS